MTKTLILILALTLPGAAFAHDPLRAPQQATDNRLWLDSDGVAPRAAGDGRVRLVPHQDDRLSAFTVNQFDAYQLAYRKRLTELSRHMSVHRAMPRARHDAYHAVIAAFGETLTTEAFRTAPLTGARITPGW